MSLRNYTVVATWLLIGLFSVACGETQGHSSAFTDNGTRIGGDSDGDGDLDQTGADYFLELVGDDHLEVMLGDSVDVVTRLTDRDGNAVENQSISYEIWNSPADPDIRLEALAIFVDDDGYASNRLNVGGSIGAITVRASHHWVDDPVELTVDVSAPPVGDLQISVTHAEQHLMELGAFDVRTWKTSHVPCQMVPPYSLPANAPIDEAHLPTLFDQAVFHEYDSMETYTVAVMGHGSHGQISAKGCVEGIELIPDDTVHVEVPMELLPLSPTGEYDVISYWDFREALASTGGVGSTIVELLEWVANPAGMIAEYLMDEFIGPWFCDDWGESWYNWYDDSNSCLAFRAYEASYDPTQTLEDFVNDQVINQIGILSDLQEIGEDLRDTVANMKVESILTIDNKAFGEGELSGHDSWRAIYFYWTRNCGPNDPPDCGEIRIGLNDTSEFGVMEADWDGRLFDYNQLEIDPHDMTLPYGQLITYILNQHMLPWLTNGNANNLGEAFEYLLCNNIGDFTLAGYTIDASTLQGFCSTAFNLAGFAADIYLSNLTYSIDLFISGVGTMVDLESNAIVDVIEEGFFLGEFIDEDGNSTDMHSEFTAERRN